MSNVELMEKLKSYIKQHPNLVVRKQSVRYPDLFVVKYKSNVFYDGLWNEYLEECRGLVLDQDDNVIVHPFRKIYNRFECNTDIPRDELTTSVVKVNGFMGAATYNRKYGIIYSTTGSLDSPFLFMVEKHLSGKDYDEGYTYLFEICDPSDPHIIPEEFGAYLIGRRNIDTGEMSSEPTLDKIAATLGFKRPEWTTSRFSEVVQEVKTVKHEGFVVHGINTTLKLKSPYYLTKKLFARINGNKLTYDWFQNQRKKIDEEYYPLIDHIEMNRDEFVQWDETARLEFIRNFLNG